MEFFGISVALISFLLIYGLAIASAFDKNPENVSYTFYRGARIKQHKWPTTGFGLAVVLWVIYGIVWLVVQSMK